MQKFFTDSFELRTRIIQTCKEMSELGLCIATWGNISIRLGKNVLITPSRIDYDKMTEQDMVVVDPDGNKVAGDRLPSSETLLHCELLKSRPDIPVWIHSHAPNSSAFACRHEAIPVIAEDMAQIIGGTVNCSEYVPGGRHKELAEAAVLALHKEAAAVLLANHGVIVGGCSLEEALAATLVLEKAAGMMLCGAGKVVPIPDELVKEERFRYLYKYGKE